MGVKRKRDTAALTASVHEFVCPITLMLPSDPVIAEDGRVYQASAIKRWLRDSPRSPHTNLAMGTALLPTPQLKWFLRSLVEANLVTGTLAHDVQEQLRREEWVRTETAKARDGDVKAMHEVGFAHWHGLRGLEEDHKVAVQWFQRAHAMGHVPATRDLGKCFLIGSCDDHDVHDSLVKGMALLNLAAHRGDNYAKFSLGQYFAEGKHNFPHDELLARFWFLSCDAGGLTADRAAVRNEWLAAHPLANDDDDDDARNA
jgi:hypothetical protein